jgi:3-hydroxymyristoyl/3-hydroxydecanoyl-(acyl carrier protein) dehydratase
MPARAQSMSPAPPLPPTLDEEPEPPPGVVPRLDDTTTQDASAVDATMPIEDGARAAFDVPAFAHLDRVHREFLAAFSASQQRYLSTQVQLLRDLAAHAAPGAAPTPSTRAAVFARPALEAHAGGRLADIFGPEFAASDGYRRRLRLPLPPLLLVDRILHLDAAPGSLGTGRVVSETEVRADSPYLHAARMPAGIMAEAGQAVLVLLSWLGFDRKNRGERVYRLLGYDMTYHAPLPQVGDTLEYRVHVDGHASQGDVSLSFFHYDCYREGQLVLSLRNGQSGFFTDAELHGSDGIGWEPASDARTFDSELAAPEAVCEKRSFTDTDVEAFAAGDALACFGPSFEPTRRHARTPRIAAGAWQLIDRVPELAPNGGPWGRGYLRAELSVTPDDWFFKAHFKNDPCLPGTLMMEGSLQAMAFYMSALGFTRDRDDHRFEPMPNRTLSLRCRGQVTPSSKRLVYEVFVRELMSGPVPVLTADVLCSVDGHKAMHASNVCLRLAPNRATR